MIRNHPTDIVEKFKVEGADDIVLDGFVFLLGFVPVTFFSTFGKKNVDISIAFTACSTNTLKLFQIHNVSFGAW